MRAEVNALDFLVAERFGRLDLSAITWADESLAEELDKRVGSIGRHFDRDFLCIFKCECKCDASTKRNFYLGCEETHNSIYFRCFMLLLRLKD